MIYSLFLFAVNWIKVFLEGIQTLSPISTTHFLIFLERTRWPCRQSTQLRTRGLPEGPGMRLAWQNTTLYAKGTRYLQNLSWLQCPPIKIAMACLRTILRDESQTVGNGSLRYFSLTLSQTYVPTWVFLNWQKHHHHLDHFWWPLMTFFYHGDIIFSFFCHQQMWCTFFNYLLFSFL